jgi:hypothetical protein
MQIDTLLDRKETEKTEREPRLRLITAVVDKKKKIKCIFIAALINIQGIA